MPSKDDRDNAEKKRVISGPGAADFIAAPGGEDIPGVSPSKGTSGLRETPDLVDRTKLEPAPAPEVEPPKHERTRLLGHEQRISDDENKRASDDEND